MTRRLFAVLMTFVMLTAFCFTSASADGYAFVLEAKSDSYELSKGDSFSVTFFANGISEPSGLLAVDACIRYDSEHLKFVNADKIVPSKWDGSDIAAPETTPGKIDLKVHFDGTKFDETMGTTEDNTLGFKLNFTVETSSATYTTISVPEGIELSGTTGLPNIDSCKGSGTSYTLSLNQANMDSSGDVSSPTQSTDDISSDNSDNSEDTSSENGISGEISGDNTEDSSNEDTSSDLSDENPSEDEEENSSNGSDLNSSQDDEPKKGINILLLLGIACALVAIIAVVVYISKTKKNDMNPVNPS